MGAVGNKGDKAYLIYMAMRLLEMHRLLKPTGSIYLHCDPTMSHSLKMMMDAIFGKANFRNEIVWCYKSGGASKRWFARKHDTLLFYAKNGKCCEFNLLKVKSYGQSGGGHGGAVKYHKDEKGIYSIVMARDWWEIPMLATTHSERLGYPTQKPLALLRRIIEASSNEGDMVLDPFCGCATTCVAAQDLGREWIGIDISPLAAKLIKDRMELGFFGRINPRTDLPKRTDQSPRPSRNINHDLFGKQEGRCNGCGHAFPFQNFTRDHVIPTVRGGGNTDTNLQLLCGHCNSIKGDRDMPYLLSQLKQKGYLPG